MQDETLREIRGHLDEAKSQLDALRCICPPVLRALTLCTPKLPKRLEWEWQSDNNQWCAELNGKRFSISVDVITCSFDAIDHRGGPLSHHESFKQAAQWCQDHADSLADAAPPGVVQAIFKRVCSIKPAIDVKDNYAIGFINAKNECLAIIDEEAAKHD